MRFGVTLLQYSFLVFTGKPDVKMRSPMGMHEFKTLDLKFCTSKCMCSFCDVWKLENPILERRNQRRVRPRSRIVTFHLP